MIQPYLDAVDRRGERGVVYIDGEYSHAFTKGPLLRNPGVPTTGLFAEEEIESAEPTVAERRTADRALESVERSFGRLLYARFDLIDTAEDRPVVIEAELTEPSLYHATAPGSADRLAAALVGRLQS